jgi:hypothetical protein
MLTEQLSGGCAALAACNLLSPQPAALGSIVIAPPGR